MPNSNLLPDGFITQITPILKAHGVNSVYLFGSRVDNTASASSDYDLGVLLRDLNHKRHDALFASELEVDLMQATKIPIDVVLVQRASITLKYTIIAEGKVIYCIDADYRTDFEDIVLRDYLDFKPFLDRFYQEMHEAIAER